MLPDLSIVVGSVESARRIHPALSSLAAASAGLTTETIVVDASSDDSATRAARFGAVQVHRRPVGTLVPHLWADGIRLARAPIVATTTAHTVVDSRWAHALVGAFDDPKVGGVGGPLTLAPGASSVDAAVFLLRYSAFLPSRMPDGPTAGEIAGDNAAYRRADVLAHPDTLHDGFWEIPFHARLRAAGRQLVVRRNAVAEFDAAFPLHVIATHRFRHGREFGAARVRSGKYTRWRVVAAAPLVPGLLACRAAARVMGDPAHRRRLPGAMPALLMLSGAWAFGEAYGALSGWSTVAQSRLA